MKLREYSSAGFTLVELMIVVATAAILVAIAIPQYADYTARSQLSEGVSLGAAAKLRLTQHRSEDSTAAFCALHPDLVTSGRYVQDLTVLNASATSCDIVVKMRPSLAAKASDKTITFSFRADTPSGDGWTCSTDAASEVAPKACR